MSIMDSDTCSEREKKRERERGDQIKEMDKAGKGNTEKKEEEEECGE